MKDAKLRKYLKENYPEIKILDNPSFDNSIIGISNDRLVYDMNKMVEELAKDDEIDVIEAYEFIDYNTLRAIPYLGADAPIIVDTEVIDIARCY